MELLAYVWSQLGCSLELGWVKDGVSDQPDLGEIPWAVLDDVWRPEFAEPEADGELRAIVRYFECFRNLEEVST